MKTNGVFAFPSPLKPGDSSSVDAEANPTSRSDSTEPLNAILVSAMFVEMAVGYAVASRAVEVRGSWRVGVLGATAAVAARARSRSSSTTPLGWLPTSTQLGQAGGAPRAQPHFREQDRARAKT